MRNIEAMNTPKTRAEFERNFHLLRAKIKDGQYSSPSMLGLDKVRLLPNGRIDLLSINESARLQANTIAHFNTGRMKELMEKHSVESE